MCPVRSLSVLWMLKVSKDEALKSVVLEANIPFLQTSEPQRPEGHPDDHKITFACFCACSFP